jgi:hypothetical protein
MDGGREGGMEGGLWVPLRSSACTQPAVVVLVVVMDTMGWHPSAAVPPGSAVPVR